MALQLSIPPEYGYVLLTASLSVFVNQWTAHRVGTFRKAAKIPYPNAYATAQEAKESKEKYLFNCAQRAHANYLEHWPSMLVGLAAGGLKYPLASAGMGSVWIVARILYSVGYTNKDKPDGKGRLIGTFFYLPELGLQILTGLTGYKMLMG